MSNPNPSPKTRIKPGQILNPKGRRTAGCTVKEFVNAFCEKGFDEKRLRSIARDKFATWAQRTAAERMLRTLEAGDLADFEKVLDGSETLSGLRASGVNTEVVKKIKHKTRTIASSGDAPPEVEIEREIELFDRAGDDFDRILDRTEGKPVQAVEHSGAMELTGINIVVPGMPAPTKLVK